VDTTLKRAKRRRHIDYCEQHQEWLFAVANRYKSRTRVRLAVSPIPINRKPRRSAGVDFMHTVIALPVAIIFFSATALLAIALPTHRGAGVRETGEGVQQPSDAAEGCGLGKITWACLGR
jgi:hypothetical protein